MSITAEHINRNDPVRSRLTSVKLGLGKLSGALMQVRDFMSTNIGVCVPGANCAQAGGMMGRRECGFLAVVDNQKARRVLGIVTDRSILLHLVASGHEPSAASVRDCLTPMRTMISPQSNLDVAVRVMRKEALYYLPVVEDGKLIGVLSLENIAVAVRRHPSHIGPHVTEQQVTEILEAVGMASERRRKAARQR